MLFPVLPQFITFCPLLGQRIINTTLKILPSSDRALSPSTKDSETSSPKMRFVNESEEDKGDSSKDEDIKIAMKLSMEEVQLSFI